MSHLLKNLKYGALGLALIVIVIATYGYDRHYWKTLDTNTGLNTKVSKVQKELISKHKPVLRGDKQNTPTVDTDTILTNEKDLNAAVSKGDITLIFFKVGCPVCQAKYQNDHSFASKNKTMYFVNTDSKLGLKLVKHFNLQHPYSIVRLKTSKAWSTAEYHVSVTTSVDDSKAVLDSLQNP